MPSTTATRRGVIGAAAGAGAGYALGGPALEALATGRERECLPAPPGIATGAIAIASGREIWVTDTLASTIAARRGQGTRRGRSIDVGGAPVGIAITPDGERALVTTARYDRPGLAVIRLRSGRVSRFEIGAEPGAVAIAADGKRAYVLSEGRKGALIPVDARSGRAGRPIPVGRNPRGLALTPDGELAVVTLNGGGGVALVKLGKDPRVRRIKTARYPAAVAISPDGRRAIVTHDGYGDRKVSVIDLREREVKRRTTVGADPAGVAFGRSRAVVATRSGRAVVLDSYGRVLRRVKLGGFPGAVAAAGARAYVADSRSGRLHRVRIGAGR